MNIHKKKVEYRVKRIRKHHIEDDGDKDEEEDENHIYKKEVL